MAISVRYSKKVTLKHNAVYHGDALKLLVKLPKNSVRLLLTDPPYNVSRKNGLTSMGRHGLEFGEWDVNFDQTAWLELAAPAIMPGGSIVIFNDWQNLGDISRRLKELGFDVKRKLSWIKNNPFPRNITRSFVQATEDALWAVKKSNKQKWVFNKSVNKSYETGLFVYPTQKSDHPTKKPTELFKELCEILSNHGDLVVDPFAGAGTLACAAELTNRKHISFEANKDYYELALKNLQEVKEKLKKHASRI